MLKKWNESYARWSDFKRMFIWANTYTLIIAFNYFFMGNWYGWKYQMTMWAIVNGCVCIFSSIKYTLKHRNEDGSLSDPAIGKLVLKRLGICAVAGVCAFGLFFGMQHIYVRRQIRRMTNFATASECNITITMDEGSKEKEIKLSDTQREELLGLIKKESQFSEIIEENQKGEEVTKENKAYTVDIEKGDKWKYLCIYQTWNGNWLLDSIGRIGVGEMKETKAYVLKLFE